MESIVSTRWTIDASQLDEVMERAADAPLKCVNLFRQFFHNETPDQLCWVFNTRMDRVPEEYEISSLWNAAMVFPGLIKDVVQRMGDQTGLFFEPSDFFIVRTRGHIPIHKDEGSTMTKLNFGLRNSEKSRTATYNERGELKDSLILQQGQGYILNPHSNHAVIPLDDSTDYRYIASFKTTVHFSKVRALAAHLAAL